MKFLLLLVTSLLILQIQAKKDYVDEDEQQNLEDEADVKDANESNHDALNDDDEEVALSDLDIDSENPLVTNRKTTTCTCGIPKRKVNGSFTQNRFPWAMQLTHIPAHSTTQKFFCGATLINNRYALASASCFANVTSTIYARIINKVGDQASGYVRTATVKKHPRYNPTTRNADLALLKLNATIPLSDSAIVPICVPVQFYQLAGKNGFTASWGHMAGGPISKSVRVGKTHIIANKDCSKMTNQYKITNSMVCASPLVSKTACHSDNGGPLSVIDPDAKRHLLAGVGSFGYGCGNNKKMSPGVYTRIFPFISFVAKNSADGVFCSK